MRLRHQPLQVVHESFTAVLRVLIMPADVNRFFRAHLLAVPTEDAAELVDLEHERIAVSHLVFARHELDAVRGADRRTQATRNAFRLAVFGREHPVRSAPARRERPLLVGILDGHLVRVEQMLERERHALERGAHVARLLDRTLEHFDADGHQSAPPSVVAALAAARRAGRSYRARRSLSRSRRSSREYAVLMRRPRSKK